MRSFYEVKNINSQYIRRWIQNHQRRVFRIAHYEFNGDTFRVVYQQGVGFDRGYEYGYSLGVF